MIAHENSILLRLSICIFIQDPLVPPCIELLILLLKKLYLTAYVRGLFCIVVFPFQLIFTYLYCPLLLIFSTVLDKVPHLFRSCSFFLSLVPNLQLQGRRLLVQVQNWKFLNAKRDSLWVTAMKPSMPWTNKKLQNLFNCVWRPRNQNTSMAVKVNYLLLLILTDRHNISEAKKMYPSYSRKSIKKFKGIVAASSHV